MSNVTTMPLPWKALNNATRFTVKTAHGDYEVTKGQNGNWEGTFNGTRLASGCVYLTADIAKEVCQGHWNWMNHSGPAKADAMYLIPQGAKNG